jgi:hypothetical protein
MRTAISVLTIASGTALGGFMATSNQGSVNGQSFDAIQFSGTLVDAYDYAGSEFDGSGNGVLSQSVLTADSVNVFLVNASDGLGLFVVFGNGISGSSSSVRSADGTLSFSPGTQNQTLLVEDDASDTLLQENVSTDPYSFDFRWSPLFTDGLVSTFDGPDTALTLDLTSFANVSGFTLHGANGAKWSGSFGDAGGLANGSLGDYITINTVNAIPLPHAGALAGVGLLGLGVTRRRR